jgi:hypothetical protein
MVQILNTFSQRHEIFKHLRFNRVIPPAPRRRRTGRGSDLPQRNNLEHGRALRNQVNEVQNNIRNRNYPAEINPRLIFIIEERESESKISEDQFQNADLDLLFQNNQGHYVLFSNDAEMRTFFQRLDRYQNWTVEQRTRNNQSNPDYASFYARIQTIRTIEPEDRIGDNLKTPYENQELEEEFLIHLNLWWLGERETQLFFREIHDLVENHGFEVIDEYANFRTANLVIRVDYNLLNIILTLDPIYKVNLLKISDQRRRKHFDYSLQDLDPNIFNPPERNATKICVIDTGVAKNHPALEKCIIEEKKFGLPEDSIESDQDGHGTENAGIVAYGNIHKMIRDDEFNPCCYILSAKISENNQVQNFSHLYKYIAEAIEYYYQKYGCIIFYLSFFDDIPLNDDIHPKDQTLSVILDELINLYNVCIICPTGNSNIFTQRDEYIPTLIDRYPELLFTNNRIFLGASAISALTVGSISGYNQSDITSSIARYNTPASIQDISPFTRVGPGFNESIKPEILAIGGNQAFDADGYIHSIDDLSVLSLNFDFLNQNLFTLTTGTCLSAAFVGNSIGILANLYPGYNGNLYRALLINRLDDFNFTDQFLSNLRDEFKNNLNKYLGYGILSKKDKILYGTSNSIVLFNEDSISYDDVHYYKIPIPESFNPGTSTRKIRITLAFNPPIQPTRQEYLCIKMTAYCVRSTSGIEDVRRRFSNFEENSLNTYTDFRDANVNITNRTKGTIQSATYSFQRITPAYQSAEYFVVVRCSKKPWFSPLPNQNNQNYAIVASVEQEGNNNLYNEISITVRERIFQNRN